MKTAFILTLLLFCSCNSKVSSTDGETPIFAKGELAPANFTGKAWVKPLVPNDTVFNTLIGNVYFEPGARSNWHTHPAGQILIITDGKGYYQEKGKPKRMLKKGDVVTCLPNVMHWHGASPDAGLYQLSIISKADKGIVNWLGPVTDEEYNSGVK